MTAKTAHATAPNHPYLSAPGDTHDPAHAIAYK